MVVKCLSSWYVSVREKGKFENITAENAKRNLSTIFSHEAQKETSAVKLMLFTKYLFSEFYFMVLL